MTVDLLLIAVVVQTRLVIPGERHESMSAEIYLLVPEGLQMTTVNVQIVDAWWPIMTVDLLMMTVDMQAIGWWSLENIAKGVLQTFCFATEEVFDCILVKTVV